MALMDGYDMAAQRIQAIPGERGADVSFFFILAFGGHSAPEETRHKLTLTLILWDF